MKEFDNLRLYLPAAVVNHVQRRVGEDSWRQEPPDYQIANSMVLFADVAGFTKTAQRLSNYDHIHGMEKLAEELNKYLTQIVKKISRAGGDVLKFAGDAIIATWPLDEGDDDHRAQVQTPVQCAVDIQEYVTSKDAQGKLKSSFRIILDEKNDDNNISLFVKFGLGMGKVAILHLGGMNDNRITERFEYFSIGDALQQAFNSEARAAPGQTVVTEDICKIVSTNCKVESLGDGFHKVTGVEKSVPWKRDVFQVDERVKEKVVRKLWKYVPASVMLFLMETNAEFWLPEIRRVTTLFVTLDLKTIVKQIMQDEDEHSPANKAMQTIFSRIQRYVFRFQGTINKFSYDDKGCTLVAVFGLPPISHDNDADRAVLCALALMGVLGHDSIDGAIGISSGAVFTGIVGHGVDRREYTVLGHSVNIAARLMVEAKRDGVDSKIFVDHSTRISVREDIAFKEQPERPLKGITDKVRISCVEGTAGVLSGIAQIKGEARDDLLSLGGLHVATLKHKLKERGAGGRFIRRNLKPRMGEASLGNEAREIIRGAMGGPNLRNQLMKKVEAHRVHKVKKAIIHYSVLQKKASEGKKGEKFAEYIDKEIVIEVTPQMHTLGDIKFELMERLPSDFELLPGNDVQLAYFKPDPTKPRKDAAGRALPQTFLGKETVNLSEEYSLLRFPADQDSLDLHLTQHPELKRTIPAPQSVGTRGKDIYTVRDKLEESINDFVLRGRGGVVLVEGPHGVGKTYTIAQTVLVENTMTEVQLASGNLYETGGQRQQAFSIFWIILGNLLASRGVTDSDEKEECIREALQKASDVYDDSVEARVPKATEFEKKQHKFNEEDLSELNTFLETHFPAPRKHTKAWRAFQTIANPRKQANTMKKIIGTRASEGTDVEGADDPMKVKALVTLICAIISGLSTKENPSVVFIDNTHEMDPYSWLIIEELAEWWSKASVLVILAYRTTLEIEEDSNMPLNNRVSVVVQRTMKHRTRSASLSEELQMSTNYLHDQVKERPEVRCIELLPAPEYTETLICDLLNVLKVPKPLVEYLQDYAGGNVLYIRDAMNQYLDNGLIDYTEDKTGFTVKPEWLAARAAQTLPIPVSVIYNYSEQIDSLQPGQQVALKVASVIWKRKAECMAKIGLDPDTVRLRLKNEIQNKMLDSVFQDTIKSRQKSGKDVKELKEAYAFLKEFGANLYFTLDFVMEVYPLKNMVHSLDEDWEVLEQAGIIAREEKAARRSKGTLSGVNFQFRMLWFLTCLENSMLIAQKTRIEVNIQQVFSRRLRKQEKEKARIAEEESVLRLKGLSADELEFAGWLRIAKFRKGGYKRRYCVLKEGQIEQYDAEGDVGTKSKIKGVIFLDGTIAQIRPYKHEEEKKKMITFNKKYYHSVITTDKWKKLGEMFYEQREYTIGVENKKEWITWTQRIEDQIKLVRMTVYIDKVRPRDIPKIAFEEGIRQFWKTDRTLNAREVETLAQRLDVNLIYNIAEMSLVQRKDNRVRGYILGYISPLQIEVGVIHACAVRYDLRGQGIGRSLFNEFIEFCARRMCQHVRSIIARDDVKAMEFHQKLGFREDVAESNRLNEMGGNHVMYVKDIKRNMLFVDD